MLSMPALYIGGPLIRASSVLSHMINCIIARSIAAGDLPLH
jgi:hypothetical protein